MEIRFSFVANLFKVATIVIALIGLMPTGSYSGAPNRLSSLTSDSTTSQPQKQQQQRQQLDNKCAVWSCRQRAQRPEIEPAEDSRPCSCDQSCALYDDCCRDAPRAAAFGRRLELGSARLHELRDQWHCHRLNRAFGSILIKATCDSSWLTSREDKVAAGQVQRRCEYIKDRGKKGTSNDDWIGIDPLGMLMPVTDLMSGITYANSYCLRCNRLAPSSANRSRSETSSKRMKQEQIIYWSPLLECNYNPESDDRNTLYDLISAKKGQVLQYSSARNKWMIMMDKAGAASSSSGSSEEHLCTVQPTPPESAEHLLRHCMPDIIDRCPSEELEVFSSSAATELQSAQLECELGHQALAFSETTNDVYFNSGCAKCNNEHEFTCSKRQQQQQQRKPTGGFGIMSVGSDEPEEPTGGGGGGGQNATKEQSQGASGFPFDAARSGVIHSGRPMSFSFTLLMDIYGSSDADTLVGSVHKCPDRNQLFDPFNLLCFDKFCGLEQQLVGDKCVAIKGPTRGDLVDKFNPAMAYVTTICLSISIASLAMYLLLYCSSMLDLRPLVVDMAQQRQQQQQLQLGGDPLGKGRASRSSAELAGNMSSAKSQSLSSRGVACLASSLLVAYLLFIAGHQSKTTTTTSHSSVESDQLADSNSNNNNNNSSSQVALGCLLIAIATYYCFLVAFNWMFLLSYDIWRTLRLATCQLRAPAMHSQSRRFLFYSLFALIVSALIVGLSVVFDQLPLECQQQAAADQLQGSQVGGGGGGKNCTYIENEMARFALIYKPNFGQRAGSCWFSNRRSLALFFGLPVALIMLANLVFFLHSSFMVIKTSSRSSRKFASSCNSQNLNSSSSGAGIRQQQAPLERSEKFSPKLISVVSRGDSNISSNSTDSGCYQDYTVQNSLTTNSVISVQTIQSQLSATPEEQEQQEETCSSGAEESPGPPDGAANSAGNQQQQQQQHQAKQHRRPRGPTGKLEHKSHSSLTNQSIGSSASSASSSVSLTLKYDSHLHNLSCFMGSIVKDYKLYCRLSTIMGLTWLTGLMASVVDQSDALWYLFVVLNTLQGLFIFIAFGCKRSKLANVEILMAYLRFKWQQKRSDWMIEKQNKNSNNNAKDTENNNHTTSAPTSEIAAPEALDAAAKSSPS